MSAIVQEGEAVLRAIAEPVPVDWFGGEKLLALVADMKRTLDNEVDGVALAAPQIAVPYRIFIVRYDRMRAPAEDGVERPEYGIFINPEIVKSSRRRIEMDEGCLSVRGIYGTTLRHERATVRAKDEYGKTFERGGGDILAQAFQHETDHLNGMLFIDHAERLYRPNERAETVAHKPFVFFGTPYVASDTLSELVARGYRPELVITSPDAPRGRGMQLMPCAAKEAALSHALPVETPEKLDAAFIERMKDTGAEYAIVVAYGKILPKALIEAFPLGVLNIHYSLLPKYRGASPVEAALLNGDDTTGVSIQKMVYELDAGDILATKVLSIHPSETTRELRPRLIDAGSELLTEILPAFEAGEITPVPQDAAKITKCGKIDKSEGELDLAGDQRLNWNKYRAYAESPGTYFFTDLPAGRQGKNGKRMRVKIKTAAFENGAFTPLRVVPEGKKEMDYSDFIRA